MLMTYQINKENAQAICAELISDWQKADKKIFFIRNSEVVPDTRAFYESLFSSLGTPVQLAEDVKLGDRSKQRTGEIWMEVRYDPNYPNAYRHSSAAQPLHTDGSYIPSFPNSTLLCCVSNTAAGGETIFIDSTDIIASLQKEDPALLDALMITPLRHERSGDSRILPVIYYKNDLPHINWNYYCVSQNISSEEKILAESFHNYLQISQDIKAKTVAVKLSPGDAVLWKDHEVLHGRNSFTPKHESERFIWKCAFDVGVFA